MNILILTKKFPYPAKDGETVAILQMIKGLNCCGHQISVLSINTHKHFSSVEQLPRHIQQLAKFDAVTVNTNPNIFSAIRNVFSKDSYHYSRFYCAEFASVLKEKLQQQSFDIIQLEGLYLMQYLSLIRSYSKAKVVLRTHNIEYEIWERTTASLSFSLKKNYLQWQTARLKNFEQQNFKLCDGIVSISNQDAKKIKAIEPNLEIINIPVGFDFHEIKVAESDADNMNIGHLGAMDWLPNEIGVLWFLEKVWPKVTAALPPAKLFLAGRNMPESILKHETTNNVSLIGEVKNPIEFMSDKALSIVPLLSGSGIRVKIIENMALGKCIVSTSVGAEGIGARHQENILLADDETTFASNIIWALQHPEKRKEIGNRARHFAIQNFDLKQLSNSLTQFYQKIGA